MDIFGKREFSFNFKGLSTCDYYECGPTDKVRIIYTIIYEAIIDFTKRVYNASVFYLCEECFYKSLEIIHEIKGKLGYLLFETLFLMKILGKIYLDDDCTNLVIINAIKFSQ